MKRIDHFLSEEDIALHDMRWEEVIAWWNLWLKQAQITNDADQNDYSHGVFRNEPRIKIKAPLRKSRR